MYVADYVRFGSIGGRNVQTLCIALDLAEEMEKEELVSYLNGLCLACPNRSVGDLLFGLVNIKVGEEFLKSLGLDRSRPFSSLTEQEKEKIAKTLKNWRFSVKGLPGWDKAQITAGGVPLSEVQLHTMQSCKMPGLYFVGEMLDAHGECGGYNLNFAWVTGILAGQAAAENKITI